MVVSPSPSKLLSSAEPAINNDGLLAYSPFQQGHGQVNATRAVTLGQTGCGNQELDLEQELAGIDHFEGPAIVDENGKSTLPGHETMISPQPADKGPSTSRKWGVKDHIERDESASETTMNDEESPFDWAKVYLREKAQIEGIGSQPKK